MFFFQRAEKITKSEKQHLISLYKNKAAWINWYNILKEKSELYKGTIHNSSLWYLQAGLQAGLIGERLSSLSDTYNKLSTSQAQPLVEEKLNESLLSVQGDSQKLIAQWNKDIMQLKKTCAELEEQIRQDVSQSARLIGGLAHSITSQPSYAFASTCYNELALAARSDPKLAPYLSLDDVYLGFFKNMTGCVVLALEVGLYFYLNLRAAAAIMFIQTFFAHDKVRELFYYASERYLPGHEYSILSGLRGSVSFISTLFFFIIQCSSDTSLTEGLMKCGTLAVMGLALERITSKVSTQLSTTLINPDRPHQAYVMKNMIQHLFLLCAWLYMYPWLLQSIEPYFRTSPNTTADALKTLGLGESATPEEIKQQVKVLLRTYHPDHNSEPIAKAMTQKILEAAQVLKETNRHSVHKP